MVLAALIVSPHLVNEMPLDDGLARF